MNPKAKLIFNVFSIVFAALFFFPSIAIVASWNALPGDNLYSTKRILEKIALAITSPFYSTNTSLHTQLISRRTDEAIDSVLKNSSSKGLDELRIELEILRAQIAAAPTQKEKDRLALKAVTQLQKTQAKLTQTKTTIARANPTTTINTTTTITIREEIVRYIPLPTQTPFPQVEEETTDDLEEEIEDVQKDIDDAIDELDNPANDPPIPPADLDPASPTPTPTPTTQPPAANPPQNQGNPPSQSQDASPSGQNP